MKQTVPIIKYPLDLSGTNPNNLVIQEFHDIGPDTGRALAPNHGPFFTESLKVVERATGRVLTPHDDYMVLQPYQSATRRTGKPVAAVIYVHNKDVDDEITIEYQVVGGEFSWSIFAIKQLIEDLSLDNRPVYWGDIIGRPIYFPPAPHLHPLSDTFGWEFIGYQLEEIARAILNGDVGAHEELMRIINLQFDEVRLRIEALKTYAENHTNDLNNPHQVTKAQVGLGLVENFRIATKPEAEAGVASNVYMTPQRTAEAIEILAGALLRAHTSDLNNPHKTTKGHVGLGSVENYPIASKAEAEAGVATNRYMTPQRTAEAINILAGALLRAHINDKANPHQVTKAQVGLGLLENYVPLTGPQNTLIGTLPDSGYTQGYIRSSDFITAGKSLVAQKVTPHIDNMNNPHGTTKAHVGLGNLPNAISDSRGLNNSATLATSKAIFDHVASGDHDARYVQKDAQVNTSIHWANGRAYVWGDGAWRQIWPAQWS